MNTLEQIAGLQRLAGLTLILTATLGFNFKKNTFGFSFYIDLQSAENKKKESKDFCNRLASSMYINQAEMNNFILVYKK